jgi:Domain of unknown function (DUF1905)/Bacteriocin-protection, YdeI or OmpD-Associated
VRFRTEILSSGKTATGIEIPHEVINALNAGKKPAVQVTIAGYTYRSTVASRSGRYLVGVNATNRERAGVAAGDVVDVDIELDSGGREVEVPADFASALDRDPKASSFFGTLTPSQRKWFVQGIEGGEEARNKAEANREGNPGASRRSQAMTTNQTGGDMVQERAQAVPKVSRSVQQDPAPDTPRHRPRRGVGLLRGHARFGSQLRLSGVVADRPAAGRAAPRAARCRGLALAIHR